MSAEAVRSYLREHPVVRDALAMELVNVSALARVIAESSGSHVDAVTSAIRRLDLDAPSESSVVQAQLAESRIEVRTGVGMLCFDPNWRLLGELAGKMQSLPDTERAHLYHGVEAILVVAEEDLLDELVRVLHRNPPFARETGLAELNVKSGEVLREVPGFLAEITGKLSRRGIRIVDMTTCQRDHVFLIEEADVPTALAALRVVIS